MYKHREIEATLLRGCVEEKCIELSSIAGPERKQTLYYGDGAEQSDCTSKMRSEGKKL